MQKLLRELDVIELAVKLLQLPFQKGVDIEEVGSHPEVISWANPVSLCSCCCKFDKAGFEDLRMY